MEGGELHALDRKIAKETKEKKGKKKRDVEKSKKQGKDEE